jgi:LuxR family maltose regulon positive regulatory protein
MGSLFLNDACSQEQGRLLATKWQIPQLPPLFVPRPHLIEQMQAAVARRLTLLSAPAGFGKTTLLAEWCRSTHLAVTWLTLEAEENEPTRFLTYLLATVRQGEPCLAPCPSPHLTEVHPPALEAILTHLINDLAAPAEREQVVVLDGYHLISSDTIHQAVGFLLEHLPESLHLVIATRADPPFPLARWRGQGHLAELRTEALRFAEQEVARLLQQTDLALSEDVVYHITGRTEGWITGVQLAALACYRASATALALPSHLPPATTESFIAAYLEAEILAKLSPDLLDFLVQTSLLQRLCGSLCDAVTERSESQAILEWLCQTNQFTEALSGPGRWYRYHPLFKEVLQRRLEEHDPERVRALHRRASLWYEQHGMLEPAIEHALSAQDEVRAAALLETATCTCFAQGHYSALLGWLERLPRSLVLTHPRLGILYAWMLICDERIEQAQVVVQLVERRLGEREEETSAEGSASRVLAVASTSRERRAEEDAACSLLATMLAWLRQETPPTLAQVRQVLQTARETSPFLERLATWHLGWIALLESDFTGAEAAWRRAWTPEPTVGLDLGHLAALSALADLYEARGELWQEARLFEEARRLLIRRGEAHAPLMGWIWLGISRLSHEHNALTQARTSAQQALLLGQEAHWEELLLTSLLTLAATAFAQGQREASEHWLHAFALFLQEHAVPASIQARLEASRARLELRSGKMEFALEWARRRGLSPGEGVRSTLNEAECCDSVALTREALVLARLLLAKARRHQAGEDAQQALALLDQVRQRAERTGLTGRRIEATLLQALALQMQGKIGQATAHLKQAVELAEPRGYLRLFADEGAPMAALLAKLQGQHQDASGYLHTLLQACVSAEQRALLAPPLDPPEPLQSRQGVLTPLSPRESEILRLLATGASNQDIAASLVITQETVKRHVRHILAKLSATNRTQAVVRARDLQLL